MQQPSGNFPLPWSSRVFVVNSGDFDTAVSFSLAVSMWINVEDIQDGEQQWLFDATGPCSGGSEKNHRFLEEQTFILSL